jgi:hypothetical protein
MIKIVSLFAFVIIAINSLSQKTVFKYPIEFSKGTFEKRDYDSYYLNDPVSLNSILVLKDNKKAEYLLLDKNMKLVSKFSPVDGLTNTVFKFDEEHYMGGTAGDGKFYFIYVVVNKKLGGGNSDIYIETVDAINTMVSNKKLFETPKGEKPLASFSNYGQYFSITAENETNQLKFYHLNSKGELIQKSITVTPSANKKRDKLSEYLAGIKVINEDDETGLETGTEKAKLFHTKEQLVFVINEGDEPTRIISVDTKTFIASEKFIDHSQLLAGGDKGKSYVNSFLLDDKLFSLVLNKKNIQIATYDIASGKQLKNFEISESTNTAFAKYPSHEERKGRDFREKDIDDIKKLIKFFDKGSEAIVATQDKKGRIIITVGTYDPITPPSNVGSYQKQPDLFEGTTHNASGGAIPIMRSMPYRYVPGAPIYTSQLANYYSSTNFKLMLDSTGTNLVRGLAPISVNNQIKDYMNEVDAKAEAKNQFSVNQKQYFGYYSRELKTYMIEEIIIRK